MGFHSKPAVYVGQVTVKVEHLERSLQFYQDEIGFSILKQTSESATLTADGKTGILTLEQPEHVERNSKKTTGLYHFALLLPKRSDLAELVLHWIETGTQFASSDHLVSEALYLSDPDGNGIEIYVDRDPAAWTWQGDQVAMTVDPLDFPDLLSTGTQDAWTGLPKGTVMGHIHLHVSELVQTEAFYAKGLGFEVVSRLGSQALFMGSNRYHHHIGLNTWNGIGAPQPSANNTGLKYFTLIYPDETALQLTVNRLKQLQAVVEHFGDVLVTHDPSGNEIHLTV